jgi:arsenate reductase
VELLRERGVEFDAIEYLKTPPTREALEKILAMLEGPAAELVRKDKRFTELGLKAEDYTEPKKIVALLLEHPELMQRPIVIRGNRAIIARPPEKLTALL